MSPLELNLAPGWKAYVVDKNGRSTGVELAQKVVARTGLPHRLAVIEGDGVLSDEGAVYVTLSGDRRPGGIVNDKELDPDKIIEIGGLIIEGKWA